MNELTRVLTKLILRGVRRGGTPGCGSYGVEATVGGKFRMRDGQTQCLIGLILLGEDTGERYESYHAVTKRILSERGVETDVSELEFVWEGNWGREYMKEVRDMVRDLNPNECVVATDGVERVLLSPVEDEQCGECGENMARWQPWGVEGGPGPVCDECLEEGGWEIEQ